MDRQRQITSEPLLAVDISADYAEKPRVLDGVRFEVGVGEALGLIGESGSGKSTVAMAVMRLLELRGGHTRGSIRFGGRNLMALPERDLREIRGREIGLVPQSPISALNPALKIETQLRGAWRAHRYEAWSAGRDETLETMRGMGLECGATFLRRYPRQLSVGQAQRVTIAMAVMHAPKLLVADEPTSALDPESRESILDIFRRLNRDRGMAILYVSHDLDSVLRVCRRAGVLERGRIAACGPVQEIIGGRTRGLVAFSASVAAAAR